jgi:hypothetical protein
MNTSVASICPARMVMVRLKWNSGSPQHPLATKTEIGRSRHQHPEGGVALTHRKTVPYKVEQRDIRAFGIGYEGGHSGVERPMSAFLTMVAGHAPAPRSLSPRAARLRQRPWKMKAGLSLDPPSSMRRHEVNRVSRKLRERRRSPDRKAGLLAISAVRDRRDKRWDRPASSPCAVRNAVAAN